MSSKSVQQECPARVSSKSVKKKCQERVSSKSVLSRLSCQERPARECFQECPARRCCSLMTAIHLHKEKTSIFISALVSVHSALHKVTAFGFVGSIRFFLKKLLVLVCTWWCRSWIRCWVRVCRIVRGEVGSLCGGLGRGG